MLILGIETATPQVGCAVGGHEGVLASAGASRGRRHAESLAPMIDFVRRQAVVEFDDLGAVAVDLGPGLFTGLRVGVSSAKSLAFALRVPIVGVSSLDLLAFPCRLSSRLIVAVVDARRGEVFHARYRQVPGGVQRITEPAVSTPGDLVNDLLATPGELLMVGDGVTRYEKVFSELGHAELADVGLSHPNAGSLVQLAHARALREEFVQPWEVEPLYLREPDAAASWAVATAIGSDPDIDPLPDPGETA